MREGPIHPIETESYRIMTLEVDLSAWPPDQYDIVARVVHATADESFADSMRIGGRAVQAAVEALRAGAAVVCDARMVLAGLAVEGGVCYLDQVKVASALTTRSAGAIGVAATRHPDGAIWVIGNAPTALVRLLDLVDEGAMRPAAVIGLPVGYFGAAEAKDALWESPIREISVTNTGRRGGSAAAAAALNAIARLAN